MTGPRRRMAVVEGRRPVPDRAVARRRWVAAGVASLLVACAGCASAGAAGPQPAGAQPSKAARMVCGAEARKEVADALGTADTGAVVPTWVDHLYSCTYPYANGHIGLSVKELDDAASTGAYFASVQRSLGTGAAVGGLGQGAYQGADGSIVVRKDYKVLDVDVSAIPAQFGVPPIDKSEAAVRIAIVVMGCWTDH